MSQQRWNQFLGDISNNKFKQYVSYPYPAPASAPVPAQAPAPSFAPSYAAPAMPAAPLPTLRSPYEITLLSMQHELEMHEANVRNAAELLQRGIINNDVYNVLDDAKQKIEKLRRMIAEEAGRYVKPADSQPHDYGHIVQQADSWNSAHK